MLQYFNCNERLEIFLTSFCNILCYVGGLRYRLRKLHIQKAIEVKIFCWLCRIYKKRNFSIPDSQREFQVSSTKQQIEKKRGHQKSFLAFTENNEKKRIGYESCIHFGSPGVVSSAFAWAVNRCKL